MSEIPNYSTPWTPLLPIMKGMLRDAQLGDLLMNIIDLGWSLPLVEMG